MDDILIGAIIAIITAMITLSFTEYIKYYFSLKKDEQSLIFESLKNMKSILIKTKFDLRELCISCYDIEGKPVHKFSPNEWKNFSKVLIELYAVAFELSTFSKTVNLSK